MNKRVRKKRQQQHDGMRDLVESIIGVVGQAGYGVTYPQDGDGLHLRSIDIHVYSRHDRTSTVEVCTSCVSGSNNDVSIPIMRYERSK